MLSVKQYADSRGISGTAVRKQLDRYSEELEGHIIETSRRRMLDDVAISFLDQHRQSRTMVIDGEATLADQVEVLQKQVKKLQETSMAEQIEFLKRELKESQERVIQLQAGMIEMMKLKDENLKLLSDNQKKEAALTEKSEALERKEAEITEKDAVIQAKEAELNVMDVTLHDVKDRLQQAEEEVNSFQKSLFGFYRKVKK